MAAREFLRQLLAYSLIGVFGTSVVAQSLGDLAREQHQKKSSPQQSDAAQRKAFSNLDNPQLPAITPNGQTARHTNPEAQQLLQIDSPADGTVVNPGQTIKVRVTSSTERTWAFVGVLLSIPNVPPTEVVHSLPVEFSITIPAKADIGRYSLTAMGRTTAGELEESDSIDIVVERPDMPVSLSELNLTHLYIEAQGSTYPLLILAHFADGNVMDTRESGKVTFSSTDTKIVTVDGTGTAMAVATGTAGIIVSYRNPSGPDVRLTIPVTVERFQVTFSPSSLDFGNVWVGSSASLSVTVTNNTFSNMLLMIKAITASGPYSEKDNCTSSSPLAVGAKCEIRVTFTPAEPRQSPGTLNIVDSASGVASVILMSGNGVK
jgi:hypothetical protein